MNKKEKVILSSLVIFLIFCVFNPAFARRIANFDSKADVLHQIERKLTITVEPIKKWQHNKSGGCR